MPCPCAPKKLTDEALAPERAPGWLSLFSIPVEAGAAKTGGAALKDIDGLTAPATANTVSISAGAASDGVGLDSLDVSSTISGAFSGGASIPTSSAGTPPSLVNGIRGDDPLNKV